MTAYAVRRIWKSSTPYAVSENLLRRTPYLKIFYAVRRAPYAVRRNHTAYGVNLRRMKKLEWKFYTGTRGACNYIQNAGVMLF